jgi:hypothetical protein
MDFNRPMTGNSLLLASFENNFSFVPTVCVCVTLSLSSSVGWPGTSFSLLYVLCSHSSIFLFSASTAASSPSGTIRFTTSNVLTDET